MNSYQRRKAVRAGTHYRCDYCGHVRKLPYRALTGCDWCWSRRPIVVKHLAIDFGKGEQR